MQVTENQCGLNKSKHNIEKNVLVIYLKSTGRDLTSGVALNDISSTKFLFIPLGWIPSQIFFYPCSGKEF